MPGSDVSAGSRRHRNGSAAIRTFFPTNQQPIYFVGPTAFNLLGIDRWVRNFQYIAYYDSWDGQHPRVFTPENRPYVEFESSEQINNYLLRDPEVREYLSRRGGTPMVAMVFFDEETEEICREQGYTLVLPADSLRRRLDSKIVTTQLGNEAGAPSVPNVLGHADSYAALAALARGAGLGDDLVVQTPYGDSGKTTFFITSESDWNEFADDIDGQELKVMKRINNQAAAVEACITRHGTIVGPFMTDLTGYPELTPYKGGWCGNDVFPEALSEVDVWSQLIMKEPGDDVERILAAPRTGAWRLSDSGALTFEHVTNDWHEITTEDEAFFMRVYGPGDFKFHGADLGILVTKGRMQTPEGLTERCRRYIEGIRAQYKSEPLPQAPPVMPIAYVK